ncbi:Quinol monooxygenase YgiN [Pustulibacterium marinum]|uniref:Quinol monooxygenase YgiN n=1 Tax=Pustulibacterium marinum TaxID=1224947 RepID=A0A1I7HGF8_9FLAO|nr:putative quinol monooxygenase [Pustulibacterium marinum]SFU59820.1 Quinol monooxygenase YgiN [Pustulibacterium marinum]
MIYVIAKSVAKTDKIDETKKAMTALLEPTHSEDGCIQYDLHQDQDKPEIFFFYERWESREILDKHLKSDHLKIWSDQQKELLAEPMEVIFLDKVDSRMQT